MTEPPTITCPACGMTSANPTDVTEGWCGKCKAYTGAIAKLTSFEAGMPRMTPLHYDRQGHPISLARWTWLYESDRAATGYRRVDDTFIGEHWRVSTIWEGVFITPLPDLPPLIFETAVFKDGEFMDSFKWPSEASARAGHAMCVEQFTEIAAEGQPKQ